METADKNGVRILVVDDDDIVREVVRTLLTGEGYTVVTARDGLEAITALKTETVHLIVTDLRMPGIDGIEVLRESVRLDPDRPVIILTAYGTLDIALKAIREGAYDYMTKPFKMEEMIIRVNNAYERARLVAKFKVLRKSLREILFQVMVCQQGEEGPRRMVMDWMSHIEALKNMEILDADEAYRIKERLIGEW